MFSENAWISGMYQMEEKLNISILNARGATIFWPLVVYDKCNTQYDLQQEWFILTHVINVCFLHWAM